MIIEKLFKNHHFEDTLIVIFEIVMIEASGGKHLMICIDGKATATSATNTAATASPIINTTVDI